MLGTNHRLPLSHMAKSYICLKETNEHISEFSIVYLINPTLSINKYFKEQVTKFMKNTFDAMTQQHISFRKKRVLALFMFYETRQKTKEMFQSVELCHL